MENTTILALTVLGVISPWFIQFIKVWLKNVSSFWLTVIVLIVSLAISVGVTIWQGQFAINNVEAILVTTVFVFGVTTAVYNVLKKQVANSIGKIIK